MGSLRFRAVLRDRLLKESFLVLRGTPATVDEDLDAVVRSRGGSSAQGAEEVGVELGYARNPVVEDRRAGRDGAVSLAQRALVLTDGRAAGDDAVVLAQRTTLLTDRPAAGDDTVWLVRRAEIRIAQEDEDARDW